MKNAKNEDQELSRSNGGFREYTPPTLRHGTTGGTLMLRTGVYVSLLLMCCERARADDWPGWRGPGNRGISAEKDLPTSWTSTENVRWKVAVPGAGVSAPIVWKDRIFLTSSDGAKNDRLHVFCYHADDGKLLWHTRLFGTAPTDLYPQGGMAVPTATTDGKNVYVLFGTGELAALDFEGRPVWIRALAKEYGPFRNRWGMGSSPILVEGSLIVLVDHWSQSYMLSVDPATGENRWKADRPEAVNWSTPLPVKVEGKTQLVTIGTHHVRGYDFATGKELWHVNGTHQQCIPSPVVLDNLLLACSGDNTLAIKLDGGTGDLTKSKVVWKNKKASAFLPSPIQYGDHIYVTGDKGFAICLDARTGNQVWKERLGDSFHASPIAANGLIYFSSKEGVVRVVKAGPTFEEVARNDFGETLIASPAAANGRLYFRTEKNLICISR